MSHGMKAEHGRKLQRRSSGKKGIDGEECLIDD
jgi:hypothetical protein